MKDEWAKEATRLNMLHALEHNVDAVGHNPGVETRSEKLLDDQPVRVHSFMLPRY